MQHLQAVDPRLLISFSIKNSNKQTNGRTARMSNSLGSHRKGWDALVVRELV